MPENQLFLASEVQTAFLKMLHKYVLLTGGKHLCMVYQEILSLTRLHYSAPTHSMWLSSSLSLYTNVSCFDLTCKCAHVIFRSTITKLSLSIEHATHLLHCPVSENIVTAIVFINNLNFTSILIYQSMHWSTCTIFLFQVIQYEYTF